jgi:hypothetical protein
VRDRFCSKIGESVALLLSADRILVCSSYAIVLNRYNVAEQTDKKIVS